MISANSKRPSTGRRRNEPRENAIKVAIEREAKKRRPQLLLRKTIGDVGGITGDPDFHGCYKGRAFGIEIKRPGGTVTPLQRQRLREWCAAGALVGVAHSAAQFFRLLDGEVEDAESVRDRDC